jgi:hypothetical protein
MVQRWRRCNGTHYLLREWLSSECYNMMLRIISADIQLDGTSWNSRSLRDDDWDSFHLRNLQLHWSNFDRIFFKIFFNLIDVVFRDLLDFRNVFINFSCAIKGIISIEH